jgi:hypothetical protein
MSVVETLTVKHGAKDAIDDRLGIIEANAGINNAQGFKSWDIVNLDPAAYGRFSTDKEAMERAAVPSAQYAEGALERLHLKFNVEGEEGEHGTDYHSLQVCINRFYSPLIGLEHGTDLPLG